MLDFILVFSLYVCSVTSTDFSVTECVNNPCAVNEAGPCNVYNSGSGCSQCAANFFKIDVNYPCVSCQETFGSQCSFCSDFNGCQQCGDGYDRTMTSIESNSGIVHNIYYCEENPCSTTNMDESHCKVCDNGLCSQCISGYFKSTPNEDSSVILCIECVSNNGAGIGCKHCTDNNGCQQCDQGYQRIWDTNTVDDSIY